MISIIVPVYNAEKYLDQCIQSVLAQTYTNWELLLIDDGSTDSSRAICEKYATQDSRIRIFHKENGGANSARKLGVQYACGTYTMFIDSDDTIDANGLNDVIKYIDRDPSDIIVAHTSHPFKLLDKSSYLQDLLTGDCWGSLCAKLYRTEVLVNHFRDISRDLTMGGDLMQNINLVQYVTRIVYCNSHFYNYRRNTTSVSNTFVRTWEYEKKYHNAIGEMLQNNIFNDSSLSGDEKQLIFIAWQRSRLNGVKQIVFNGFNIPNDIEFINLKRLLQSHSNELTLEEILLVYCTNITLCRFCLRVIRKIKHICS